jgi:hypothetical protein
MTAPAGGPAPCPLHGDRHSIGACRQIDRLIAQGGTAKEVNWNRYIEYKQDLSDYRRTFWLFRLFQSKPKRVKPPRHLLAPTSKHKRIRRRMKSQGEWK